MENGSCERTEISVTALHDARMTWKGNSYADSISRRYRDCDWFKISGDIWFRVESTYGDRHHDRADPTILLGKAIRETAARGGVTIIPSFAVGRAQTLLHYMYLLKKAGEISASIPIYLNSPMAVEA